MFAIRLKELRLKNKLTKIYLSKLLKICTNTLTRWENGKGLPKARHIRILAVIFNVSTDYLLGLEDL